MPIFILVAALMAAIAAAVVAVPLLRVRGNRWVGVLSALVVAGAAAGFYPLWSNWDWHAPAQTQAMTPDVQAMVAKLEKHMQDDPSDVTGWIMLGRSYLALQRLDPAVKAYDRAHTLDGKNAEASLGLGEALSLRAGGNITPVAAALFEDTLKLEPQNPKALLYGGFAAIARGDKLAARDRWEALEALHPPKQIEDMLDARIAELGLPAGSNAVGASPAASAAAGGANSEPLATVNVSLAPALRGKLTQAVPLFIFAREPGGQGPPLAAKRLSSELIGSQVQLSAADSMVPGRVLRSGQKVAITARVSFSGQPLPAPGDLYGELTYDVGHDGVRELVIDRVVTDRVAE